MRSVSLSLVPPPAAWDYMGMFWRFSSRRRRARSTRLRCEGGEALVAEPLQSITANASLAISLARGPLLSPSPAWERIVRGTSEPGGLVILPEIIARSNGREFLSNVMEEACRRGSAIITRAAKSYDDEIEFQDRGIDVAIDVFREEMFSTFRKLYRGLSPNEGQRAAFQALPQLAEHGGVMIVIMPTGSGKSAIYQVASRVFAAAGLGSYALVISPLRALMRDQIARSRSLGLRAEMIDSSVPSERREEIMNDVEMGLVDLLYISPERMQEEAMRALIERSPPSIFVLDEAHAAIEWGYSFRPSYVYAIKLIASMRKYHRPPVLALSATMSEAAIEELLSLLGYERRGTPAPVIIKIGSLREDIEFQIVPAPQGYERLEVLERMVKEKIEESRRLGEPWRGVIFTSYASSASARWANVSTIAAYLSKRLDVEVISYHGGMRDRDRERAELALRGKSKELVVVSTKALGMGVDVPNIRWVVHYIMSDSIEDFYQEVGRAGRDGRGASSVLLYNHMDADLKVLLSELPRPSFLMRVLNTIASISKVAEGQIIFPDTLFSAPRKTIVALEVLRSVGMVDYHILSRGRPGIGGGSYSMRIDGLSISVPGSGGVEYYSCQGPLSLAVSISHEGKEIFKVGRCAGSWTAVEWSGRSIIVEPLSDMRPFIKPPPHLYTLYLRELSLEEMKIEKLRALIELSIAAGKSEMLRGLAKHFEGGKAFDGKNVLELALGEVRCSNCDEMAARLAIEAELSLGRRGISLYYDSREALESFHRSYKRIAGVPPMLRSGSVDGLLRDIGRRGPDAIFDRGLVLLLSSRRSSTQRAIEYLKDHGYFSAFLW